MQVAGDHPYSAQPQRQMVRVLFPTLAGVNTVLHFHLSQIERRQAATRSAPSAANLLKGDGVRQ